VAKVFHDIDFWYHCNKQFSPITNIEAK